MAGHCIIINGRPSFIDYADAEGSAIVNGREWRWEYTEFLGPLWMRKDGNSRVNQFPTSKAVWAAFDAWLAEWKKVKVKK